MVALLVGGGLALVIFVALLFVTRSILWPVPWDLVAHAGWCSVWAGGAVTLLVDSVPVVWWALTSPREDHSQLGTLAGYGILLALWVFVMPELVARTTYDRRTRRRA